jgi:hypothetical protein
MASGHEIQVDTTLWIDEKRAPKLPVSVTILPMFVFQKGNLSHEYLSVNGQFLRHLDGANCFSPPHL